MRVFSQFLGIALVTALIFTGGAWAQFEKPVIKEWTQIEKDDKGEDKEIAYMTIDGIKVHETDTNKQPLPSVVKPGMRPGAPPSDAVVLFDGTDLSNWEPVNEDDGMKWIVKDGTLQPTVKSGMIQSKQEFGSCQLHIEFATPVEVKGDGQGRGNSGVFLQGEYEVQILDSFNNVTYADGQAAAIYGRSKPLVNASKRPGQWQSYDIVYHRPEFNKNGEVTKRATFTVFHNGVLVQDHYESTGGTGWRGPHSISNYKPHGDKGPIKLQDHGNPVLFRNIWVRPLPEPPLAVVADARLDNDWWLPRHEEKVTEVEARRDEIELVFIGDSITHGWEKKGAPTWDKHFAQYGAYNIGYSGDRTENVIWRLRSGEIDGIDPKGVVMMIGTNNTGHRQEPAEYTAAGVEAILHELSFRAPNAKVLLLAIFPRGEKPEDPLRMLNDEINARLEKLADGKRVLFQDISDVFLADDGTLPKEVMPDLLHPNEAGYELWAEAIKDNVAKIMGQ
jgi:lysophospholipase L1-like esterase